MIWRMASSGPYDDRRACDHALARRYWDVVRKTARRGGGPGL
jgi:hypothetical protein